MDEELDRAAHERLQQLLKEDEQACQWYGQVMLVHSLLSLDGRHATLELPPAVIPHLSCASADCEDQPIDFERNPLQTIKATSHRTAKTSGPTSDQRQNRRLPARRVLLATAASLAMIAAGIYQFASLSTQVAVPFRGADVARVKHEVGARFVYGVDANPRPEAGTMLKRGKYELIDGLVELEYDSGARLVMMAPAEFTLIDEMNVKLDEGKVSAHIPEAAIGFTIDAIGGQVVDLGTAFAVDARRDEQTEVHVFEGEVRIELHQSSNEEIEPVELFAGHATRINAGSPVVSGIDINTRKFVRNLGFGQDAYANAIIALNPAIYYRMEPSGNGDVLEDSSASGVDALIHRGATVGSPWAGGRVGAALGLGGPTERTYAIARNYPKAPGDELSVVCWVYAESRPFWASIAKNWGYDGSRGQFHFGLLDSTGELAAHIVDKSHMYDEAGEWIDLCAQDSVPLPLNQWHHVAMVADGVALRLYRNGEEVDSVPYDTLYSNPRLTSLAIGAKLDEQGLAAADGWSLWEGRLDELAIFNHALSPERIKDLYEISKEGVESSSEQLGRLNSQQD
jgi:hypothetical protein